MGPCFKATVRCTIVAPDGRQFVGENICQNPQASCPREAGEDYTKCTTVCRQIGHAEQVAAYLAGDRAAGGVAYLGGHTYACDPCLAALANVGVTDVRIQTPATQQPLGKTEAACVSGESPFHKSNNNENFGDNNDA